MGTNRQMQIEKHEPSEPERLCRLILDLCRVDTGRADDPAEVLEEVQTIQREFIEASYENLGEAVRLLADWTEQNVSIAIAERG